MFSPILETFNIPQLQKFIVIYKELLHEYDSCPVLKSLWYKYKIYKLRKSMFAYIETADIYELIAGIVGIQLNNPQDYIFYITNDNTVRYQIKRVPGNEYVLFDITEGPKNVAITAGPAHHLLLNKEIDARVTYTLWVETGKRYVSEFNINRYNDNELDKYLDPTMDPKLNTDRMLRVCVKYFMEWVIDK